MLFKLLILSTAVGQLQHAFVNKREKYQKTQSLMNRHPRSVNTITLSNKRASAFSLFYINSLARLAYKADHTANMQQPLTWTVGRYHHRKSFHPCGLDQRACKHQAREVTIGTRRWKGIFDDISYFAQTAT